LGSASGLATHQDLSVPVTGAGVAGVTGAVEIGAGVALSTS